MKIEARIESASKNKFNFYYPNVHPATGEVTEGCFKDKTLKEIKDFAQRRGIAADVSDVIKQVSGTQSQKKRAKAQAAEAARLEKWEKGEWFRRGEDLRWSGIGKAWRKIKKIGSPDRTYFNHELTEQIFSEAGIEYKGFDLFYDHEKNEWSAKKIGVRNSKTLNAYLKKA